MSKIHELIRRALSEGASDIHLTEQEHPVLRINGALLFLKEYPAMDTVAMEEVVNTFVLSEPGRAKYFRERYFDSSFEAEGSRFRAHFYYQRGRMACALRSIPMMIPKFEELNLPAVVRTFAHLKNGLVLVTGTTGSGKSTTLASMINDINNTQNRHIITVEDPIEFQYKNNRCIINQKEVGSDVASFSEAVRSAMREDPDIILVGEMRDLDTIGNALTMAETGHLVFGTLHTKNSAETIDRVIDVFPPEQQQQVRVQLSTTLRGVVGQTLVRNLKGGRAPLCEVMVVTDAIKAVIKDKNNPGGVSAINDTIMTNYKKNGSQTYTQSAVNLIKQGIINIEIANQVVDDPKKLQELLRLGGM